MKAKACVKGARACPESVDDAILSAAFLVSPTDRESRIEIYREIEIGRRLFLATPCQLRSQSQLNFFAKDGTALSQNYQSAGAPAPARRAPADQRTEHRCFRF